MFYKIQGRSLVGLSIKYNSCDRARGRIHILKPSDWNLLLQKHRQIHAGGKLERLRLTEPIEGITEVGHREHLGGVHPVPPQQLHVVTWPRAAGPHLPLCNTNNRVFSCWSEAEASLLQTSVSNCYITTNVFSCVLSLTGTKLQKPCYTSLLKPVLWP